MAINSQHYREKVSQMISWGHWFTLFNILLSLGLGSRYLFVANWPTSLLGRVYALVSWLGHFSFISFSVYLLMIFPLTFVVMSQRLLRFLSAALATIGLTLLLVDSEVFTRFHLHVNSLVWELVLDPEQSELARDWQLMLIWIPIIFLVEMLFGTWCWQKLRSLNRRRMGKPLAMLFICAFLTSHLIYAWADANFYRPVTAQRANFPLSSPMTARKFLEKHGLLDPLEFQRKLTQQGAPEAIAVEYPLSKITFSDTGSGYNLLMIVVDGMHSESALKDMPTLSYMAESNIQFSNHYSSGTQKDTGLFGLLYGISPIYIDSILAAREPSALISALGTQGYQFGLFSSDGFDTPLYRQALLADFSLSAPTQQSNSQTAAQWQQWLNSHNRNTPWFSYISLSVATKAHHKIENQPLAPTADFIRRYQVEAQDTDQQITRILDTLQKSGEWDQTVIIITAEYGMVFDKATEGDGEMAGSFNHQQLQVPLVIHWPSAPAQTINKLTSHEDIMTTLMQRLLHVNTTSDDYSQGEDLFAAKRRRNWVITSKNNMLVITTPTHTILLNKNGTYRIYEQNGSETIKDKRPHLALLLQILTDVKRFIAH